MIEPTARDAWRDLEARLRPFVARRVRSAVDVDDVIQEVFLRMQRSLADLRDEERFGPWVYRIARSAIGDHHRATARHGLADGETRDEPAGSATADAADDDDDLAASAAAARCMAPFVAALPSPYREALTLAELEGMSQRDAAERLGVSLSAMKSRVQRGRGQVRDALTSCCKIALDVRGRVMSCETRRGGLSGCDT